MDLTETEVEAETDGQSGAEERWDGNQVYRISYTLNGQPQVYTTAFGGDWFDPGIFSQIDAQLANMGLESRVWLSVTDGQTVSMLYGSPVWAERFMRETGLPLLCTEQPQG